MKDIVKIINRLKGEMAKVNLDNPKDITLHDCLNTLAGEVATGNQNARDLFIKYGIYDSDFVEKELPWFYKLIENKVENLEEKKALKSGIAPEKIKRLKKLDELGENRIIGYARVSTADQHLERQLKSLEEAGCQVIFKEKISGKNTSRPELKELLNILKKGDTVIVSELTRLARSTKDLFNLMADFEKLGVSVKSLKESWLDTSTAHGKLLFTIMSGMAQFERELMLERQQEGIKVAKENGVKFGQKLKEDANLELAIQLVKKGEYTKTQIAKMCNVSRTTLWREIKKLDLD